MYIVRICRLVAFFCLVASQLFSQNVKAKYVFFFIGDGMGLNQVYGTELLLKNNSSSPDSLQFFHFPVIGLSSTYSQSSWITDSAAGGTALSTGQKTSNGTIAMDSSETVMLQSLAEKASSAGLNVGIVTSVSIDHATPAVFYSHRPSRNSYYEIGSDLPKSGFSFFGGSGLLEPVNPQNKSDRNLLEIFADSGYTVVRGVEEFNRKFLQSDKMVLLQTDHHNPDRLSFALDRNDGDLTLRQLTQSAVSFLQKSDAGFFLMAEGGLIDWSAHSNDVYTTFAEVRDLDESIRFAYDFYKMHPDSTLIVVTADHETGGLALGNGPYALNLQALRSQKRSQAMLSSDILDLKYLAKERRSPVKWEEIRCLLKSKLGFWDSVSLSNQQEQRLKSAYQQMIQEKGPLVSKSEYFVDDMLAKVAIQILNEIACVGWTTENHSGMMVPVFAVGVGADSFNGIMDNTDIPKRIARIAGF